MLRVSGGQIYTLRQIPKNGINLSQLSRKLQVDVTTTNKQINMMELKGLINVERKMGNIGNHITVTKLGRNVLNEMVNRV